MSTFSARPFCIQLRFHGDLRFFLPKQNREQSFTKTLPEKTSVKDCIESCGVPHPEIDLICCDGVSVSFDHALTQDSTLEVYGVADSPAQSGEQLQLRHISSFVVDGHLGKLARDLRLLGFDVIYDRDAADSSLASACTDDRALLTRDHRLLMHRVVRHGYCPRSDDPDEQIKEVTRRFNLTETIAPFTRCLECNGLLTKVDKAEVINQLEPLTRIYYDDFRRCTNCGKIYWSGSHFGKLEARLAMIREPLG